MQRTFAALLAATLALPLVAQDAPPLAAQGRALEAGTPQRGTLAASDAHRYVVESPAEQFVTGRVDQVSVDVVVRVLGPDGELLAEFDGPARGAERFRFETTASGTHVIEVAAFEEEAGDYAVTLELFEPIATDPAARADQLLAAHDRSDGPGVAVAVWQGDEVLYERALGMADLTHGVPFSLDTPTNIGSTSKQFTAFAVLLLTERGLLSLDDDVREHIPELPDLGAIVRVRHLLTHTTGYREFLNFLMLTGRRLDHGDHIGKEEILAIVQRQPALQNEPGGEWNYNNTAYALAAVLVERTSGQSFADFLRDEVFTPIGMTRSQVRPSPAHVVPGRAVGYRPGEGGAEWLEAADLSASTGAGGIYATLHDLRRWARHLDEPVVGHANMIAAMSTPFLLTSGEPTGYGLGLFIDEQRGLRRVHHGGADSAHRSQLLRYPDIEAGITVQSNDATFDTGLAFRLGALFFGEHMQPEDAEADAIASTSEPFSFDPQEFDELAGRYELDEMPGFVLTFSRDGETLHTQATGQPQLEIRAAAPMRFELIGVDAAVTFHRDEDDAVTSLTLHQGGDHHAKRLSDDRPTPALASYVGRYFSAEAEAFYDVLNGEHGLEVRQRRLGTVALTWADGDSFAADVGTVDFERDRNGRTRDVRFQRVADVR